MEPAPPEKILEAFKILDVENNGYLTKESFGKLMMEEGEPFTQEEMDEMWPVAIDPISGHIPYELYLNQLMVCYRKYFRLSMKSNPKFSLQVYL